jgi:phosphoenolpyruvate carboxylase
MGIVEEEMKQIVSKIREAKAEEYQRAEEQNRFIQGYWHGYFNALNDILAELNKVPRVLCENLGMGFD